MHEDKFENEVQKIMDQLSFDPADTVWSNVAKGIGKDKKRRGPLFWIFFIAGPIIIGSGYFFIANNRLEKSSVINRSEKAQAFNSLTKTDSLQLKQSDNGTAMNSGLKKDQIVKKSAQTLNRPVGRINEDRALMHSDYGINARTTEHSKEEIKLNSEKNESTLAGSETIVRTDSSSTEKSKQAGAIKQPVAGDSVAHTQIAKNKDKKPTKWKIGFSGSAGISELHQDPVNQAYLFAPVTGTATGTPGNPYHAPVLSGFSFSAGGFVSRSLSGRLSISGGLNYHYYSTKTDIGGVINNSTYNNNLAATPYYAPAPSANDSSHSYTNQYHFLELPVLIDFALNKSKDISVIWEAGFSFSYLVSTNALYYDPASNFYYKNMQLYNRTQWNVSTALMMGLNRQHSQLLFGPQIQYGLSNLLKSSAVDPQHFFSYGLKISFILHNK